mmetsp:Transcript_32710/g.96667  ORF Transcript_32710/g.96667 Transcript_32710/m.96667 type:complete len:351 (-) Transcript_32710:676-1728(-)
MKRSHALLPDVMLLTSLQMMAGGLALPVAFAFGCDLDPARWWAWRRQLAVSSALLLCGTLCTNVSLVLLSVSFTHVIKTCEARANTHRRPLHSATIHPSPPFPTPQTPARNSAVLRNGHRERMGPLAAAGDGGARDGDHCQRRAPRQLVTAAQRRKGGRFGRWHRIGDAGKSVAPAAERAQQAAHVALAVGRSQCQGRRRSLALREGRHRPGGGAAKQCRRCGPGGAGAANGRRRRRSWRARWANDAGGAAAGQPYRRTAHAARDPRRLLRSLAHAPHRTERESVRALRRRQPALDHRAAPIVCGVSTRLDRHSRARRARAARCAQRHQAHHCDWTRRCSAHFIASKCRH